MLNAALREPYHDCTLARRPDVRPLLSLRDHIAQKFHGMTRTLATDVDRSAVRAACEATFQLRGEHAWPPTIALR